MKRIPRTLLSLAKFFAEHKEKMPEKVLAVKDVTHIRWDSSAEIKAALKVCPSWYICDQLGHANGELDEPKFVAPPEARLKALSYLRSLGMGNGFHEFPADSVNAAIDSRILWLTMAAEAYDDMKNVEEE